MYYLEKFKSASGLLDVRADHGKVTMGDMAHQGISQQILERCSKHSLEQQSCTEGPSPFWRTRLVLESWGTSLKACTYIFTS